MFIRFSRVFTLVCLLAMSVTISPPSSGDHNNSGGYQSVFASASCSEFERIQGYHWYTVHQAVAHARANIHNDLGDYNGGWYGIGATVNGTSDDKSNYYSGQTRVRAEVEKSYFEQPMEDVSGNGSADGYIYGVGCVDTASASSNFD